MITPDRARKLIREHDNHRPKALLVAAPDMVQTIAGMTEEWGVRFPVTGRVMWCSDLECARLAAIRRNGTIVRRLVSAPEVVDGE